MASVQMNRGTTEEIEATQLTDGLISFDTDKNYMYMDYEKDGTLVRETFGGLKNTDADLVSFDGSKSAIEATNVQDAIDEIIESGKQASAKEIITDNGTYFKESISSGGEFKLISPNGNYVKMNVSDLNYAKIESGDSTESTGNITWSKDKSLNLDTVIVTSADPIVSRDIKDQTVAKATNADKADALTVVSKGSATKPVYFNANGVPVACTYSLEKSVPSNAVFTDSFSGKTIVNNLTTTTSGSVLDARQGRALANGSARDSTKLPLNGGTVTGTTNFNSNLNVTSTLNLIGVAEQAFLTDPPMVKFSFASWSPAFIKKNAGQNLSMSASEEGYDVNIGVTDNVWSFYASNNTTRLGTANKKWGQIYSTSSTINTSDKNLKKDIVSLR